MAKVKYVSFSQLVRHYRLERGLTIQDVYECLEDKYGWETTYDSISKYDRGDRFPDLEYVILLGLCLELSEYQQNALLDAIIGDMKENLHQEYNLAVKKLYENGIL